MRDWATPKGEETTENLLRAKLDTERPLLVPERDDCTYTFRDDDVEVYDTPDLSGNDSYPLGHVELIDSGGNG